jgi:hypothetical protein
MHQDKDMMEEITGDLLRITVVVVVVQVVLVPAPVARVMVVSEYCHP